nr:hypothetical protein [Tanacetum cinerariifolium]
MGETKYQANGPYDNQCVVDIHEMNCSCRKLKLTRMPCKYAVVVINDMTITNADVRIGRPPKSRKKNACEISSQKMYANGKLSRAGKPVTCQKCNRQGHKQGLGSMSHELQIQFENYALYDMLQELKSIFEKQVGVERFDLIQTFHAYKQEEGKSISLFVLKMKSYVKQLECLGYVLSQDICVGLILNGLTNDFPSFVRNYNMHNMGKTIGERHALLIEYENGLFKKAAIPQVLAIQGGRIQKPNKKPQAVKGKGKAKGKGKNELVYASKPKNLKHVAKEHPGERKMKQGAFDLYVGNGKMTRKPFLHKTKRAIDLLRLIHTDVCGPLRHVSRQGASYFITFKDDFSRCVLIRRIKGKENGRIKGLHGVITAQVSDSEDENEIETESNQIKPSFAKVKFVKPTKNVKSPRKSIKKEENNRQSKYPRKTSQSPKVVSALQRNRKNSVKSSACWIWRPTRNVIDHISKDSGPYMLKRFNYVDLQGRLKSVKQRSMDGFEARCCIPIEERVNAAVLDIAYTYYCKMKVNAATHKLTTARMVTAVGIVDFLNANPIKYALTVTPTIYTSCIQQFWDSAKVKSVNEDVRLQALVDGKKVIVNETSIRRDLRLDDAEGTACLPNAAIFKELARMGKHKSRRKQRKETEVSQDETPTEKHIPTLSHDSLPSDEDGLQLNELMEICTKLSDRVLSLEQINTNQAAEIKKLKKRVKKLEGKKKKRTHGLKRIYKVGLSARIISSDEEGLDDQEDTSKQGRINEIDADEDLSLINETTQDQGRINDQDMFEVNDLDGDEVVVDVSAGEKEEQSKKVVEKEVSTADPVTTANELTLAKTLIEIKAAKPKALTTAATTVTTVITRPKEKGIIMQEPSETPSPKSIVSSQQLPRAKEKGKGIMIKPEKPLKKKDQIALDEEVLRKLKAQMKAEMEEEEMIARKKYEDSYD